MKKIQVIVGDYKRIVFESYEGDASLCNRIAAAIDGATVVEREYTASDIAEMVSVVSSMGAGNKKLYILGAAIGQYADEHYGEAVISAHPVVKSYDTAVTDDNLQNVLQLSTRNTPIKYTGLYVRLVNGKFNSYDARIVAAIWAKDADEAVRKCARVLRQTSPEEYYRLFCEYCKTNDGFNEKMFVHNDGSIARF